MERLTWSRMAAKTTFTWSRGTCSNVTFPFIKSSPPVCDAAAFTFTSCSEVKSSQKGSIVCQESKQTASTNTGLIMHTERNDHDQDTTLQTTHGCQTVIIKDHLCSFTPSYRKTRTTLTRSDIPGPKMRWPFNIGFFKAHAWGDISWASKGRLKGACVYTN